MVDAHVRERLIWLRQQQEDMTILLSQVSTACLHCEKTLQQVENTSRACPKGSSLGSACDCDAVCRRRTTAESCWPSRRSAVCWRRSRSSSTSLPSWPTTFSWTLASPSPSPRYAGSRPRPPRGESREGAFASVPGQQGPHRPEDGDPRGDSGPGRSWKNHHPLQAETRRVHAADPDHR